MDVVRHRIRALVKRDGVTLAEVSRTIGRNHAYLQQFMRRGTPKALPEQVRIALARYFGVDEAALRPPRSDECDSPGSGEDRPQRRVPRSFAARLSVARAESVFETPSFFAEAAGIDRLRYTDLEEGEDTPTLDELDRISRCSGKPLDWLIRGDVSRTPTNDGLTSPFGGDPTLDNNPFISPRRRKKRSQPSR